MSGRFSDRPQMDFSRISFPSDMLTIKAVREAVARRSGPDRLDLVLLGFDSDEVFEAETGLIDLLTLERQLAKEAFEVAMAGGKPSRPGKLSPAKAVERSGVRVPLLASAYQEFGLSHGPRESVQLIRGVESQAAKLAEELLGRSR
jgi:hypothetical protein